MTSQAAPPMQAADPERHPFKPGDVFEKYEIVNLIGRGGTAFVYHGYQEFLDRHVAIKIIPAQANQGQEYRRRARAEATVLSRLRHPNVVQVFDAGVSEDGAFIYIVMEKLEGRPLRELLYALGALSVPEALLIGAQVCDAVEAAHRLGVIHRDLKPENIFVERGNHAIVLDFGIAKFLGAGYATTAKHRWQGTALYMSPEHLQGKNVSPRSDIYALGTMLYEALAGGHPCLNGIDQPTIQEIAWIQVSHVAPLLTQVVPTIPDYVARIVQRAIAKAPEHRYASMLELGTALRDADRMLTLSCRDQGRYTPTVRDLVSETNTRLGSKVLAVPMAPQTPRSQSPEAPPVAEPTRAVAPISRLRGNTLRIVDGQSAPPPPVVQSPRPRPVSEAPPPARPEPGPNPAPLRAPPPREDKRRPVPARVESDRGRLRTIALGCAVGLLIAVPAGILIGLPKEDKRPVGDAAAVEPPVTVASTIASEAMPAQSVAEPTPPPIAPIASIASTTPTAPTTRPPRSVPPAPPGTAAKTAAAPPKTAEPKTTGGLVFPEPQFGKETGPKSKMPSSGL
jgi:serine/threonine protein kinase